MAVTVKLPDEKTKEEYSLFVSGNIVSKYTEPGLGTLLAVSGTGVAFYSASNSRRAVIFQELEENDYNIPLEEGKLPYIRQPVRILYKAKGRRVDLLKFMCSNLEKKYSKEVYMLGTLCWLELGSYIDSAVRKKKGSNSTRRQSYIIAEQYRRQRKRLYDNL